MLVKVFASQEGVAISRLHLKHSLLDLKDWNIECAPSQVIYSNSAKEPITFPCRISAFTMCHSASVANVINLHFVLGFVETVSQSSSCGLIDHTKDIQTSNLTSIFGSLKFIKHTPIPDRRIRQGELKVGRPCFWLISWETKADTKLLYRFQKGSFSGFEHVASTKHGQLKSDRSLPFSTLNVMM